MNSIYPWLLRHYRFIMKTKLGEKRVDTTSFCTEQTLMSHRPIKSSLTKSRGAAEKKNRHITPVDFKIITKGI